MLWRNLKEMSDEPDVDETIHEDELDELNGVSDDEEEIKEDD